MKMGVVDAKIDAVAILQAYRDKFADQDTMINSLFVQLDTELDKLGDLSRSRSDKNDVVLESEYLLTRLRSKLLVELSSIQKVLNSVSNAGATKLFKERLNMVMVYLGRLNDLRADFEVIQRTRYVDNWRR